MKISGFVLSCAAALCFGGCFKSISYDTTYVIRPYMQSEADGRIESLPGVTAYAFAVDTADWTVISYADAVAGILTSKHILTDKFSTPAAVSEPYAAPGGDPLQADWIWMQVNAPSLMIVAIDPLHHRYAYRQQVFAENLSPYYVALRLRTWGGSYSESGWRVIDEFYVPIEPNPELPPKPDDPEKPGDPENPENPVVPASPAIRQSLTTQQSPGNRAKSGEPKNPDEPETPDEPVTPAIGQSHDNSEIPAQ